MRHTYKIILGLVVVIVIVVVVAMVNTNKQFEAEKSTNQPTEFLKIGFIGPLSGDEAQWGNPPLQAAQLAIAEINAAGGIASRILELIVEDSQCQPEKGVSAFSRLMARGDVKVVIGGVCSGVTLAMAPLAEAQGVLLISPASTSRDISQAGDYVFRVIPSDAIRGQVFADYLFNDRQLAKVAYLHVNNSGGVDGKEVFVERYVEIGGQIALVETYEQSERDMRTQLIKIKSADPAAVVVLSYPEDTVAILKQAQELALNKPLYFQVESLENPGVIEDAGSSAEGAVYILPASASGEIVENFEKKYFTRYQTEAELFAAEAYDIVNIIAAGINARGYDAQQLKDYFYSVSDYQGASGIFTFDQNGDVQKPMAIKQIINGEKKLISIKK